MSTKRGQDADKHEAATFHCTQALGKVTCRIEFGRDLWNLDRLRRPTFKWRPPIPVMAMQTIEPLVYAIHSELLATMLV